MKTLLLYAVVVLIWGTTWFAIKLQLGATPSQVSVAYRFALAALLLFAWCWVRRLRVKFSLREHLWLMLQGLTVFSSNYVLFYESEKHLVSGSVAIVFSLLAVFNILNNWFFFKVKPTYQVITGALLGLFGIALTFWHELLNLGSTSDNLLGIVLSVAATLVASLGNMVFVRLRKDGMPIVQGNAFGMLYGTVILLVYASASGSKYSFDFSPGYIVSLFYLALFGSVIAFGCYLTLVGRIGADRAAYSSILFPIVALGISAVFEGYRLNVFSALGIVFVLVGNALVLARKQPGINRRGPNRETTGRAEVIEA
ncbi:MAG: EamA family transporter [Verrucomicrobia bacterium]|nr:EamA family transporter [Verrucomicrobiota bacterium]